MIGRKGRGTRIRFAVENGRRVVTVEGAGLAEVERRRLRALLRPLPIRSGVVTVRTDTTGTRRLSFTREIDERMQQVIRNIVGNLARLG